MSANCPCCGWNGRKAPFSVHTPSHTIWRDGRSIRLTPIQTQIALHLWRAWPSVASTDHIAYSVWRDRDVDAEPLVRTNISHIRTRIRALGIGIEHNGAGGYRFVEDGPALVRSGRSDRSRTELTAAREMVAA